MRHTRAIVNEPKLLICDEPTGNLDPKTSEEIMNVIEKINKESALLNSIFFQYYFSCNYIIRVSWS